MAILIPNELSDLRQKVAAKAKEKDVTIDWLKAQINLALQAIEDEWEHPATKALFSDAIETVVPGLFDNQEKKIMGRYWLSDKARREEVEL